MDQLCRVPVGRLSRIWRDVVNSIKTAFWFWFATAAALANPIAAMWLNGKSPDNGDIAQVYLLAFGATLVGSLGPVLLGAVLLKRRFTRKHWELKVNPVSDKQVYFILKQRHPHQVYAVRCVLFDPIGWRSKAEEVMSLTESCENPAYFSYPDSFGVRGPAKSGVYRTIWYAQRSPTARWVQIYKDKRAVHVPPLRDVPA